MVKRAQWPLGLILVVFLTLCTLVSGAEGLVPAAQAEGDLDGDGILEEYLLTENGLSIREGGHCLWQSPKDWKVDSFVLGDADNDGTLNLAMSLWKTSSYGSLKPFWLSDEDKSYKNHLFLYKLKNNTFKPAWCSSNLDNPIISFAIRDENNDGLNELVVEEGKYRKISEEHYGLDSKAPVRTTLWQWQEWGFSKLSGEKGVLQPNLSRPLKGKN